MAKFTQDRMYEMLGDIHKSSTKKHAKKIGIDYLSKFARGGEPCREGYNLVNGECIPDQDCEDGRCEETDQIQNILDEGSYIPKKNVNMMWDVVKQMEKRNPFGNAGNIWTGKGAQSLSKRLGMKNPPNCMWAAGMGYQCLPETKGKLPLMPFESNDKFINAVNKGTVPFYRVDKTHDPNFASQETGMLQQGDIINFKGAGNSHAMTFSNYTEDGVPIFLDSNGNATDFGFNTGLWKDFLPNKEKVAYVSRFNPEKFYEKDIKVLEEKARTNPTMIEKEYGGLHKFLVGGMPDPGDVTCPDKYEFNPITGRCVLIKGEPGFIKNDVGEWVQDVAGKTVVEDENDERYKDYLIRKHLSDISKIPDWNTRQMILEDFTKSINDPNDTEYNTYWKEYYDPEKGYDFTKGGTEDDIIDDTNNGYYGSRVQLFNNLTEDQVNENTARQFLNDQGFTKSDTFRFRDSEYKLENYKPDNYLGRATMEQATSPFWDYDFSYSDMTKPTKNSNRWTFPDTDIVENKINIEELKKIFPNITDEDIRQLYINNSIEYVSNKIIPGGYRDREFYDTKDYDNRKIISKNDKLFKDFINSTKNFDNSFVENKTMYYKPDHVQNWTESVLELIPYYSEPIDKYIVKKTVDNVDPSVELYDNPDAPEYSPSYPKNRIGYDKYNWNGGKQVGMGVKWTLPKRQKNTGGFYKKYSNEIKELQKYMEGYDDENGNHIPGEIENAEREGRQLNFQGSSSKADREAQETYLQEWLQYQTDKEAIKKQNIELLEKYGLSTEEYLAKTKEYGGLLKFVEGGASGCPKGEYWDGKNCVPGINPESDWFKLTDAQKRLLEKGNNLATVEDWYKQSPEQMEMFKSWIDEHDAETYLNQLDPDTDQSKRFNEALGNDRQWNQEWYTKRKTLPQFKDVAERRLAIKNQDMVSSLKDPINLSMDWWRTHPSEFSNVPEVFYAPEIGAITRKNIADYNTDPQGYVEKSYYTDPNGKLQNSTITHEESHIRDYFAPQKNTTDHIKKSEWTQPVILDPLQKIITAEEALSDPRNNGYAGTYQQQPTEFRARLNVWRKKNGIDPLKNYTEEELKSIIDTNLQDPNLDHQIKELYETIKNDPSKLKFVHDSYVSNDSNKDLDTAKHGGLHKFVTGGATGCKPGEYWNGTKCVPYFIPKGLSQKLVNSSATMYPPNTSPKERIRIDMERMIEAERIAKLSEEDKAIEYFLGAPKKAKYKPEPLGQNSMAAQFSRQDFNKKSYDNTGKEIKPILWDPDHTSGIDPEYKAKLAAYEALSPEEKRKAIEAGFAEEDKLLDAKSKMYSQYFEDNKYYRPLSNAFASDNTEVFNPLGPSSLEQNRNNYFIKETEQEDFMMNEVLPFSKIKESHYKNVEKSKGDPKGDRYNEAIEAQNKWHQQNGPNPTYNGGEMFDYNKQNWETMKHKLNDGYDSETKLYITPRGTYNPATKVYTPNRIGYQSSGAVQMVYPETYFMGAMGARAALIPIGETVAAKVGASAFGQATKAAWNAAVPYTAGQLTVGNAVGLGFGMHGATTIKPNLDKFIAKPSWETGADLGISTVEVLGSPGVGKAIMAGVKPLIAVSKAGINGVGALYNDVATGNSIIPYAWKNPAAALDAESSTAMFNKIIQSNNFTNAEKALIKEYQYSSSPFVKAGPKQDQFNALIQKAVVEFPNDAVVTRAFSSAGDFDSAVGTAGDFKSFSLQERPSAFSAGTSAKGKYYYGNQDRIVLSGRNLKKVEGNFVKNNYEALPEGYYGDVAAEDLAVIDHSKQLSRDIASGNREVSSADSVGSSYYGTSRLSESEIAEQAEAIYAAKTKYYSNISDTYYQPADGKVFLENGSAKTSEEAMQMAADHNLAIKNEVDLFTNPARKEEAVQSLIKYSQEKAFSASPGPVNELELMGSGFDLKTVGKFKNKHGGYDYVVQPRNIRSLKQPLNSASETVTQQSAVNAESAGSDVVANNTTTLEANSLSNGARIAYNAEKNKNTASIIEQLRYDRYLKINSPEGQRRIEELIANNPHMKNMTYEDVIKGFSSMANENAMQTVMEEELVLLTQRIKNLESSSNPNLSKIERLKSQASKLEGDILFGEEAIEAKTLNAHMARLRDLSASNSENIVLTRENAKKIKKDASPSDIYSILASPELTVDDLLRIVPHEFTHFFQQGSKTHLDKMLSKISLKNSSSSLSSNLFLNEKGASNFYNRVMGRTDPFKKMSKYWRTGSDGQEKTAFMDEVRADMLQRGMIEDLYQTITPELLQEHYVKYMGEVGNKYPLRIYEIMNNNSGNFNIMSEVLNKMPVIVPTAVGGAGAIMMQNNEENNIPKQKSGGNVKTLSKFIRK